MIRTFGILCCCCLLLNKVSAQDEIKGLNNSILLHISYSTQWPGADLAKDFGYNFNIGGGLEFMTGKGNWIAGFEGGYLFGQKVKNDVLKALRTPEGGIYGANRIFVSVQLRERGFYAGAMIGKLFSFVPGKRSGIRVTIGGGLLQHKIRIQDDSRAVPQIDGDYAKGYDHLSNGLAFNEFIGYQLINRKKTINFFVGIESTQGFTQNRRSYNFDTMQKDETKRFDLLTGVRVGWTLPIYTVDDPDEIYY